MNLCKLCWQVTCISPYPFPSLCLSGSIVAFEGSGEDLYMCVMRRAVPMHLYLQDVCWLSLFILALRFKQCAAHKFITLPTKIVRWLKQCVKMQMASPFVSVSLHAWHFCAKFSVNRLKSPIYRLHSPWTNTLLVKPKISHCVYLGKTCFQLLFGAAVHESAESRYHALHLTSKGNTQVTCIDDRLFWSSWLYYWARTTFDFGALVVCLFLVSIPFVTCFRPRCLLFQCIPACRSFSFLWHKQSVQHWRSSAVEL